MWTKLPGLIIILIIAMVGGLSAKRSDWDTVLDQPFVDGQTQEALEEEFDDSLWIREISVNLWAALRYALLREIARGAVAGQDGWLFTDEEYEAVAGYNTRFILNLSYIATLQHSLADRGITVIIVLVPDKARIMSEHLDRRRPQNVEARYESALTHLQLSGLEVVDLRPALSTLNETTPAYLRTDTHWTPEGARVVAQALAPQIQVATDARTQFETVSTEIIAHEGDLLDFVNTGPFDVITRLGSDQLQQFETTANRADMGLFDEAPAVPGILIGTSYSANSAWNFLGFLQTESQTDIINLAQTGTGPFAPMREFLDSGQVDELSPDFVVWEIPERYLTLPDED